MMVEQGGFNHLQGIGPQPAMNPSHMRRTNARGSSEYRDEYIQQMTGMTPSSTQNIDAHYARGQTQQRFDVYDTMNPGLAQPGTSDVSLGFADLLTTGHDNHLGLDQNMVSFPLQPGSQGHAQALYRGKMPSRDV
jgi:hypothetical protein